MRKQTLKKLDVAPQEAVMIGDELLADIKIKKNWVYTQFKFVELEKLEKQLKLMP